MFSYLQQKLSGLIERFKGALRGIFKKEKVDGAVLAELKEILLAADVGASTTTLLLNIITKEIEQQGSLSGAQLAVLLKQQLESLLAGVPYGGDAPIILLVGINGAGKTTTAAKLVSYYQQRGERVLLVAADTFRAGAIAQLNEWAQRLQCDIVCGQAGQDPAAVVYQGIAQYKTGSYDRVIIDTAGRLQTKTHLMHELSKMRNVVFKQLPDAHITTLLTIDATIGQNSLQQAELFHQATSLQGVILTKLDSQAKGGIVFAIAHHLQLPIVYVTTGQDIQDFALFNSQEFINTLL